MSCWICAAAAFLLMSGTPQNNGNFPCVSLSLPSDIPSEAVQIRYFMVGPFGGYASFVEPSPELHSYEFEASAEGKAATSIKILVYASGCRFRTFEFDLSQVTKINAHYVCETLPSVTLSGQLPSELLRSPNAELSVTYLAFWGNEYFGITDGAVTNFQIATVRPESTGAFRIEVPDFGADKTASSFRSKASFHLSLRNSKTGNRIALNLEPEPAEFKSEEHGLRIGSYYPPGLTFLPESQR